MDIREDKEIRHIKGLIEETDLCLELLGREDNIYNIARREELAKGYYNHSKIKGKKNKRRRNYNRSIIKGQIKGDDNV